MDLEYREKLENYVKILEDDGHIVHLPHRDTNQIDETGFRICVINRRAIEKADRVDIFYSSKSQGTHFDLGMAFALQKKLKVVENEEFNTNKKSYPNMIDYWNKHVK